MLKLLDQAEKILEGKMLNIVHGKKTFLAARIDGKIYVVEGKCTHLGCKLAEGQLEGAVVTCPCHGSRFELRGGKVVQWISNWPKPLASVTEKIGLARGLKTYAVIQKEDGLYIDID